MVNSPVTDNVTESYDVSFNNFVSFLSIILRILETFASQISSRVSFVANTLQEINFSVAEGLNE